MTLGPEKEISGDMLPESQWMPETEGWASILFLPIQTKKQKNYLKKFGGGAEQWRKW